MLRRLLAFVRRASLSLLLLGVASLVAFGIGEVLVRLVAPQQLILLRPDIWRPIDSLGWAHQVNLRTSVNTGDRTVTMVTDDHGFRTAETGRPAGKRRILLLGDSFMAAMQVEYEQSLPGLIERCFDGAPGEGVAVWNAGVSGWDPPQYLIQARRTLAEQDFDLVLVAVFLGNDVVTRRYVFPPREPDRRRTLRFPRRLSFGELVDAVLGPINDGLETRSHLFVFLKNRSQALLMRLGLTAVEVPSELRRSEAGLPRWALTGDILAEIDSIAGAKGIPTVFALIPSIEQVVPSVLQLRTRAFRVDSAALDIEQPNRLVIEQLERHGLRYISMLEPLRAAEARGVSLYGRVDMHHSADGHRVLWSTLAPVLAERLGLRPDSVGEGCSAP